MAEGDAGRMSVLDHLEELRRTILWALGLAVAGAAIAWFFSDTIVDTLLRPPRLAGEEALYFRGPMEAFFLKLKASLAVGLLAVAPLILWRVYSFVAPGLTARERRVAMPMLGAAALLFYTGVAFCFLVLLPMVVRFGLGFATDYMQPLLEVGQYFAFAARLCLAFGLLFQLPVVVFTLSALGIVDPRTLLKGWRYALVGILAASALLTPPDIISQLLLGGPVMLLYLGSVLVSMAVRRRRRPEPKEGVDKAKRPPGAD